MSSFSGLVEIFWERGYDAFHAGTDFYDNPYMGKSDIEREAWDKGWQDAEEAFKKEEMFGDLKGE